MRWIRQPVLEFWGLFVEDGPFAAGILVWVALMNFLFRRILPDEWDGPVLAAGLLVILLGSVHRSVSRLRKR